MEALHDFVVEYLEPAGVADNTRRAYVADIMGLSRLIVAARRPDSRGLSGAELARLARDTVDDGDLDGLTIQSLDASSLRRAFAAIGATPLELYAEVWCIYTFLSLFTSTFATALAVAGFEPQTVFNSPPLRTI